MKSLGLRLFKLLEAEVKLQENLDEYFFKVGDFTFLTYIIWEGSGGVEGRGNKGRVPVILKHVAYVICGSMCVGM